MCRPTTYEGAFKGCRLVVLDLSPGALCPFLFIYYFNLVNLTHEDDCAQFLLYGLHVENGEKYSCEK